MASSQKTIRVGLVGGNRLLREYLCNTIKAHVEVTCSIPTCPALSAQNLPDVILLGADSADRATLIEFRRWQPEIKLVLIDADSESVNVAHCVLLGILGFVLRDARVDDLLVTIREVAIGRTVVPPPIVGRLCEQLRKEEENGIDRMLQEDRLTKTQQRILRLVIQGFDAKAIARQENLSPFTIKNHVHQILQKLQFRNRVELIAHYRNNRRES